MKRLYRVAGASSLSVDTQDVFGTDSEHPTPGHLEVVERLSMRRLAEALTAIGSPEQFEQ